MDFIRHPHDHPGLCVDLAQMQARLRERRQALRWLLAGGTTALVAACGGGGTSSSSTSTGSGTSPTTGTDGSCIADPTETNGPYPSDGSNTVNGVVSNVLTDSGVVRGDIRASFGAFTGTAPGVPLQLTLSLVDSNNSCAPLSGYAVYIWHCTRDGLYSLYSAGAQDENFLRGVQVTDADGLCEFTTIFPGCYSGRWPHIHFEVYPSLAMATQYENRTLVSQMAMPGDICSTVYDGADGYTASIANFASISIASDNVFSDNSSAQITQQTPVLSGSVAAGYSGSILIGVPV
jgi:protocatechuate 3,4-dioxygenase beta subunit